MHRLFGLFIGMSLIVTAGCGGGGGAPSGDSTEEGQPTRGGSVSVAYNVDMSSLDPARCGTQAWQACSSIFGPLMHYNLAERKFEPGMAKGFTSTDGITWTLKLREGITFTDGTPFDAEAVVYNWERILDPANLAPAATLANTLKWRVVDPLTVEITSPSPNFQLPWSMESDMGMIGSPTAFEKLGADGFANAPVGAGPFVLDEWQRGTQMILKRNPDYWDQPRPYLDEFVIKTIPPDDQRFNALVSGDLDVMITLVTEYADKAEDANFEIESYPYIFGSGTRISFTQGDMADPDVRLAVNKLIDAEQINAAFYQGEEAPVSITPSDSPYFKSSATFPEIDVAGAQDLIDGYLARTGKDEVKLTYRLTVGSPLLDQVAEMLQAQLERVDGLKVEILPLETAQFTADAQSGNYQLMLFGPLSANPDLMYTYFHTDGSQNSSGYSNEMVDNLLEAARATDDANEQTEAYTEAIGILSEETAYRPWRFQTLRQAHSADVNGVVPSYTYWVRSDQLWRS